MNPFHVLHRKYFGEHRGYEIWYNNKPLITLRDGLELKKHEAYRLVNEFNRG